MPRFWHRSELPALLFLAALLFLFFPAAATFQGFFFVGDLLQQYYPYLTYGFEQILQHGAWPLWTDRIRLGYPLFAEGQAGFLFPTSWFYLFLPPAQAFTCVVLGNVLLAAVGMYGFLRSCTPTFPHSHTPTLPHFPRSAVLTGAVVYAFSGRFLVTLTYVSDLRVLATLPWCLWAMAWFFARPTLRRAALAAMAFFLLGFAGKPDIALRISPALLAVALLRGQRSEVGGQHHASRITHSSHTPILPHSHTPILLLLFFVLLALLLSAVQWIPTLELVQHSVRHEPMPLERWIAGSLPPQQILGFFVPHLFGNPYDGTYVGAWNFVDLNLYLGPVVGLLIVLGLCRQGRDRWLWGGLMLFGLLLALSEHLPGYRLLHEIPLLDRMRIPGRWLHLALLGASVLAAHGAAVVMETSGKDRGTVGPWDRGTPKSEIRKPKAKEGPRTIEQGTTHHSPLTRSRITDYALHIAVGAIIALLLMAAFIAFGKPSPQFLEHALGGTKVFFMESAERAEMLAVQRRLGWFQAVTLLMLATALLLLAFHVPRFRRWCLPALLGILIVDQRIYLGDFHPTQFASVYEARSPVIEFLGKHPGTRFYSPRSHEPAYFLARSRIRRGTESEALEDFYQLVSPNSALLAGLDDASGYGELAYASRPEPDLMANGLKILASWNVRFVITRPGEAPPGTKAVVQSGDAAVFEIHPGNIPERGIQAEPSVVHHLSSAIVHSPFSAVIFDSLSFRIGLALSLLGVMGIAGIYGMVMVRSEW